MNWYRKLSAAPPKAVVAVAMAKIQVPIRTRLDADQAGALRVLRGGGDRVAEPGALEARLEQPR